ncbi:acyloxyacyl hydrolase [Pseudoalteromonas luteoviolacea]|uniref:acyloxyacyl hydrolase n=1 Tax=Pseudoalteromonas luteoviolacea TaxID=43657 RepID=UPI001150395E|nr:acyloxyacyl hydrolase [Pseudoalteromonas luteoviolacea]TQF67600.1 acyloxyacyl hydrolase [Pseudoalteromonas luteoviolacea]
MKKLIAFTLLTLIASFAHASNFHGYGIHYIHGEGDVRGIKLAYEYHPPDLIPDDWHGFNMYFKSSINFWHFGDSGDYDHNLVLSMSPVFRYPVESIRNKPVHIELGIGVVLLEDTQFAGKNVSTHYQFEDRLGLVYELGKANVALRYIHYSNAGFKSPNPGLDFLSLSYSSRF